MTAILSTCIRHRVRFAPNPENTAFPTKPVFVESRLVRDVKEYPPRVSYITFDDVVETVVLLAGGKKQTIYSEPVNEELFHVVWSKESYDKMRREFLGIQVHEGLQGTVWVVAPHTHHAEGQKVA